MYSKAWYARNPYIIVIYKDINKLYSPHLHQNIYINWDNMEKPDEKHVQGLWVIFTAMNIFTVSVYRFIFSDTKTIMSSSWRTKVRKGAKSIHSTAPDILGKESKTWEIRNSLVQEAQGDDVGRSSEEKDDFSL